MARDRSADELVKRILSDPQTLEKVKGDPATELHKLAQDVDNQVPLPLEADIWLFRMVIGVIGVVALVAVVGAMVVVMNGKASDANATALLIALVSIASAAIGACAGLLSPISARG